MPHWVGVSSDEGFAYVTNEGSDNVSVVSLDSREVIATVPIGRGPRKIVIQPEGYGSAPAQPPSTFEQMTKY